MRDAPVTIRPERPDDAAGVRRVHRLAFERDAEARLVDALRHAPQYVPGLSMVAVDGDGVVGHILFSEVAVEAAAPTARGLGLGPMAVRPDEQRAGVGGALVCRGLEEAARLGYGFVVVVGHPDYYPRFGFEPARPLGLDVAYDVPDDVFMVRRLRPGGLAGVRGLVRYAAAFDEV